MGKGGVTSHSMCAQAIFVKQSVHHVCICRCVYVYVVCVSDIHMLLRRPQQYFARPPVLQGAHATCMQLPIPCSSLQGIAGGAT